jgi:hypothetical protein
MIDLLVGLFFGNVISLCLYLLIAGERINNLKYQNEMLMHEIEQKKKDLRTYQRIYRSSYERVEEEK